MKKINLFLLGINLFFLQSYLLRFKIGNYPTNLQEILIILSAIIFLIYIIKEKKIKTVIKNIPSHKIILGFLILTIASFLTANFFLNLDAIRHLKFLIFAIALVFIFMESTEKEEEKNALIEIGGLGAIIFGIFSVTYNLAGYNTAFDNRLTGPLDAAVYLAYYFAPFFLFFSINYFKNTKNKLYLLYTIFLGLLIIATRSMGTIAGIFIILSIFLYKRNELKIFQNKMAKISLIIIGIIIAVAVFYTKILPAFQTNYSSLNERGEIWQTSMELLKDPNHLLFGLGFGQFQYLYENTVTYVLQREPLDYIVLQPHNIFFLFIFQYGILGLIFLLYLMFYILKKVFKEKSTDFANTAALITLYFFLHGMIDTPFFKNDLLILLILFLEASTSQNIITAKNKNFSRKQDKFA